MHYPRYSIYFLFRCFLLPCHVLFAYILVRFITFQPPDPPQHSTTALPFLLTAYIPLSSRSIQDLHLLLEPFTSTPSPHVKHLVLLFPDILLAESQARLSQLESLDVDKFILKPVPSTKDIHTELLKEASAALTDWVLILDEYGIDDISEPSLQALWNDIALDTTPVDFSGAVSWSQTYPNDTLRQTSFRFWRDSYSFQPPLLLPTSRLETFGSVISWDTNYIPHPRDVIVLLFPSIEVVRSAMRMICGFQAQGHIPHVLLYSQQALQSSTQWLPLSLDLEACQGELIIDKLIESRDSGPATQPALLRWLDQFTFKVLFTVKEDKVVLEGLLHTTGATRIYIPKHQYHYTDWIGSLSVPELQNWHAPELTLSIITFNRPHSLQRLLHSLTTALYFGDDTLHIRFNIEKEADDEAKRLAQSFSWTHGPLQIYQRIVHGGLLAAIVESWYPHGNDSYGIPLEDDVELSPLFYAWVKMNLLKYRYGTPPNISPNLFGISLYQQKHLELPMDGRRPFDAHTLFSSHSPSIPPNSPYLSSIPCSWGAVYFPEHWREFHSYLSTRLNASMDNNTHSDTNAEQDISTARDPIVPNIRSHKWKHSWKKFFIELVYLRGYVMLYPNYPSFTSLSTNHLEAGSHVRPAMSPEKRMLFVLPLMQLPTISASPRATGLLDLPGQRLPHLSDLPVLNLTGCITTQDALLQIGRQRVKELGEVK